MGVSVCLTIPIIIKGEYLVVTPLWICWLGFPPRPFLVGRSPSSPLWLLKGVPSPGRPSPPSLVGWSPLSLLVGRSLFVFLVWWSPRSSPGWAFSPPRSLGPTTLVGWDVSLLLVWKKRKIKIMKKKRQKKKEKRKTCKKKEIKRKEKLLKKNKKRIKHRKTKEK